MKLIGCNYDKHLQAFAHLGDQATSRLLVINSYRCKRLLSAKVSYLRAINRSLSGEVTYHRVVNSNSTASSVAVVIEKLSAIACSRYCRQYLQVNEV